MMAETKQTLRKLSARNTSPRRERGSEPPSLALFEAALFAARPLPACPAGEAVQQLGNARRNSTRPLPACPAGEGVQAAKPYQAAELLHLPDKPAGVQVDRNAYREKSASSKLALPACQWPAGNYARLLRSVAIAFLALLPLACQQDMAAQP